MAEDNEDKVFRVTLESLVIKATNDELKYRNKYLPDPKRLSNDKIVCTVCSVNLASRVRKGKDIFVHPLLEVLVCKDCHSFYGDGIFSTDEDGDDKYCRWCGQGGTLYLCSKCNCGFCKRCMMKNMKNSALSEIEKDNWQCLICLPRPIFGSRAVCWASRELNNSVRKAEVLKQRLEEEKLKLTTENAEKEDEESLKSSTKRDSKGKKRIHESEESDSSTVVIPSKKLKEDSKIKKSLNGSVKKHRRKSGNSSSDSESLDDDRKSKWVKRKRKKQKKRKYVSSEESSSNSVNNREKWKSKKKSKISSDDSSSSDEIASKSKSSKKYDKKSLKWKKSKENRKEGSSSCSSNSESQEKFTPKKKKKLRSKENSLCDTSSEKEKPKSDSEDKEDTIHRNDVISVSNSYKEDDDANIVNKIINSDEEVKSEVSAKENITETEIKNTNLCGNEKPFLGASEFEDKREELPTEKSPLLANSEHPSNVEEKGVNGESQSLQLFPSVVEDEYTLSYEASSNSNETPFLSQEDEVKVKVELAIEWLDGVSTDISDLGNLIAERTIKFGKRKVNFDNLQSYDDVLLTLEKLKQLLGGIHANYKQIDDSLEDKFKSWKILAGLEHSDLEDKAFGEEEGELQTEGELVVSDEIKSDINEDTEVDINQLQVKDTFSLDLEPDENKNEFCPEVSSVVSGENKDLSAELDSKDNCGNEIVTEQVEENIQTECENEPIHVENDETVLEFNVDGGKEPTILQALENTDVDSALIQAELVLKRSKPNWAGLLSSDDDSDLNEGETQNVSGNNEKSFEDNQKSEVGDVQEKCSIVETNDENKDQLSMENEISLEKEEPTANVDKKDDNFEALQELLCSSSESENMSSESDSDDSDDLQLDDSDLDNILKPRKVIVKKSVKSKEKNVKEDISKSTKIEDEKGDEDKDGDDAQKKKDSEKKTEEPLDSEAEIDMLTDLSKLKKKTVLKRIEHKESSEESSTEEPHEDQNESKKKRKKYNKEIKEKREKDRNELFGFLDGNSSEEDEVDITKKDLDVMEDQYASGSSDSMSLKAFSHKMSEKWRELEMEQDQLNLQMLLASESDAGSDGKDNLALDSDDEKDKKKKGKKIKEEKIDSDEGNVEEVKEEVQVKEEKEDVKTEEAKNPEMPDEEYQQFMEGLTKTRTTFTGLGSSSDEDKDNGNIDIKEELLSDNESKIKKEPGNSDEGGSSNSDSSTDLFLDKTKKSEKKTVWKQHKLLRMKLSDTDTSDEERWWQRRLEREKKKKEPDDSSKKSHSPGKKKKEGGSDKENKKIKEKKIKEEEEANSSSTLEMSSTESSGSEIFQKKKKKKRKDSSDSDVVLISDTDKKKKKKKKRFNLSGNSSDESEEDDDDVIDITQKSSQGESPGKGGRKNIRKVLTKHELAAATKAAAKEEEERKKRIAARQKLFNEMFEIKEAEVLEKLVLDFDPETKTELISVDKDLVTKMKPHQAKGVKFMWDSCFESISQLKTKKGSGCILAHCMGLGKTFQVISLVHTILTNKDTNVQTVLVVCPLSTVLNWYNEFDKWLDGVSGGRNIKIYHLTKFKRPHERSKQLSLWNRTGGVMILGYEMFRILANPSTKKFRLMHTEVFQKTLIDPGADLVVCDEGHMLKNETTVLSKAMSRIRTLRRIVLTGTPMQNNLKEYHCMVQFVKPNLLGTRKEFLNQFVNPITNGQFVDSTEADVKVMKRRAHVLHKMLEGLVQRFDYNVLMPFLPPKHEYVISLRLSDVQVKLYQFYLDHFCQGSGDRRTSAQLFQDWQVLGRIWTHPQVLKWSTEKAEKEKQESSVDSEEEAKTLRPQKSIKEFFKKTKQSSSSDSVKQDSENEGSIKDFINDKSSSSSLSLSSGSSSSDDENKEKKENDRKKKDKKIKKGEKEPEESKVPATEVPVVELLDEINLISSDEEVGEKNEEVIELTESEVADTTKDVNDCVTKDHEGKTIDDSIAEETAIEDADNQGEEQKADNKEDKEKEENEGEKEKNGEEKEDKEEQQDNNEKEIENEEEKQKIEEEKKRREEVEQLGRRGAWWKSIIEPNHLEDINQSTKLVLLFAILRECEMIEDKILVFSQSLFSLDLIEYFLGKVDKATEENRLEESLGNHAGCWQKGLDYFRLDGSTSSDSRSQWCKSFNREDNPRARLFLISTRAGGLGINLTGANRVVIFDASWNPSHDIQSIFRIYRFGQKKPCYVYRFVAHGTMEEKVYDRQVAKQSLSSRVVDEQQVHRHFSMNDLNELYRFTPPQERVEKPTPVLPRDRLMAELLAQYNDLIEKYHEHDSLLENVAEEELNEEERQLAWEDYENEKKRAFLPPTPGTGVNFPAVASQIELFRKSLRLKFPNATDTEMNAMLQTLMYQVNFRTASQQVGAQQQTPRSDAGPSQPQNQNFRVVGGSNAAPAAQQMFNAQRNHLFQKYAPQIRKVPVQNMPQQRTGGSQANQQRAGTGNRQMNQQMVGNGQIRKTNRTNQEIYIDEMRKQQQANLLRIQNQRQFQQRGQQRSNQDQQQRNIAQGRFESNRQPQVSQNRHLPGHSIYKFNQPTPISTNRLQRMQQQRQNTINTLNNRKQLQVTPVPTIVKQLSTNSQLTGVNKTQQPQTSERVRQEQMRQRIKELQRQKEQKTLQQNWQQKTTKSSSVDSAHQRRLEEMKKRYNASRMKPSTGGSSSQISIVELDDEPGS